MIGTARSVAVAVLIRIDTEGAFAHLALPRTLDRSGLSARDRALVTELVNGATRRRRALDWVVDRFLSRPPPPPARAVLRLGAYQLLEMNMAAHAAVSTTVDAAPERYRGLANAVLRRVAEVAPAYRDGSLPWPNDATRLSYPDWIVKVLAADLGRDDALKALEAMNRPPPPPARGNGDSGAPAGPDAAGGGGDGGAPANNNIRGFGAWDEYAPLVAVNTAYHPTARIFTLFHEVGHLLTRTDAACQSFVIPDGHDIEAERWCERYAASFLLPEADLRKAAEGYCISPDSPTTDPDKARLIANRFSVSTRATAIRMQEIGLAEPSLYGLVASQLAERDWNISSGGGGGQTSAKKRLGQLGTRIPEMLLDAADRERLTIRDLADLLQLKTGQLDDLKEIISLNYDDVSIDD